MSRLNTVRTWLATKLSPGTQPTSQPHVTTPLPVPIPATVVTSALASPIPEGTFNATVGDKIKDFCISQGSWVLPFVICFLLAVSSGYLFANFVPFTLQADLPVKLAYLGGAALEFGGLIGVFSANRNLKIGNKGLFWLCLSGVVFFSLISALAQYVYLAHTSQLSLHDTGNLPIISWLVGYGDSRSWLFLLRAICYHTLEVFCCFLFSKREKTLAQITKENSERMQAQIASKRDEALMQVSQRINEIVDGTLLSVGKLVDTTLTNALLDMRAPASRGVDTERSPLVLLPTTNEPTNSHNGNGS